MRIQNGSILDMSHQEMFDLVHRSLTHDPPTDEPEDEKNEEEEEDAEAEAETEK